MKKYDHENSIGFIVNSTARTFQKVLDSELRKNTGITIAPAKVLYALSMDSGLTQSELADKIGIESPTLVPIIDKMEKDGFVQRKLDVHDRRVNRVYTTASSDSLLDLMIECALHVRKISIRGIPEEDLKTTLAVLKNISENLAEYLHHSMVPLVKSAKN